MNFIEKNMLNDGINKHLCDILCCPPFAEQLLFIKVYIRKKNLMSQVFSRRLKIYFISFAVQLYSDYSNKRFIINILIKI